MSAAAGWYQADPSNPSLLRYWDGAQWTQETAFRGAGAPALAEQVRAAREELTRLEAQIVKATNLMMLQEIGIYEYSHPLDDIPAYKARLEVIRDKYKALAKDGAAFTSTKKWAINGSDKDGAKMVNDLGKLMLRAYNAEADEVVRVVKPYAVETGLSRLDKARASIAKLGAAMKLAITDEFHDLRREEIKLTADYRLKDEEEKDRLRDERERLRDEEKAKKENEREQRRLEGLLEVERAKYERVITALQERGDTDAIAKHEARLEQIQKELDGVIENGANTRAGWVYVISNVGSFGERMLKIGLTRRMNPEERIDELHNASVPFKFDTHAVVFSKDAVALETELHRAFTNDRVNLKNTRKEFFYAGLEQVKQRMLSLHGDLLSFKEHPVAHDWRQSEEMRRRRLAGAPTQGDAGAASVRSI